MENTIENKAILFSVYYGLPVARSPLLNDKLPAGKCYPELALKSENKFYLELNSLSSITYKHAIEVGKLFEAANGFANDNNFTKNDVIEMLNDCPIIPYQCIDYLRSKRYAFDYMGLSVEKQIEYGWIKLKTE